MKKAIGVIFLLIGFLVFSFSGTLCTMSKMKAQEVAELIGNVAEEEDESGKEDGSDTEEAFLELYEQVRTHSVKLKHFYFSPGEDQLPVFDINISTPPPRS